MVNLESYIRNVPDFPKKGIQFKDITPLLSDPAAYNHCIQKIADEWREEQIDVIAGFDARGFLFGAPLALRMQKPFVPLRKAGKLPYHTIEQSYGLEYGTDKVAVHTDAIKRTDRVLLIDDLLATGGTAEAGCTLVERLGGVVAGVHFVIELSELKGREKLGEYDVRSLLQY